LVSHGDELRLVPGGEVCTRGQPRADGLVAMAMDSLDRTSRYRLQPHHIKRHADGGIHDPDDLATFC
jgi:hypothetical protein